MVLGGKPSGRVGRRRNFFERGVPFGAPFSRPKSIRGLDLKSVWALAVRARYEWFSLGDAKA